MSSKRECSYLSDIDSPQAISSDGTPIYYCNCGEFRTTSPKALQEHIDGEALIWYFTKSWVSLLLGILGLVLLSYPINLFLDRFFPKYRNEVETSQLTHISPFAAFEKDHWEFIHRHEVDYDPADCESVRKFSKLKKKSNCLFARNAKLLGSADWDSSCSLEENVNRSLAALARSIPDRSLRIDGFVFEIRGKEYGETIEAFGETTRRVLTAISNADPKCEDGGIQVVVTHNQLYVPQSFNLRHVFRSLLSFHPSTIFFRGNRILFHFAPANVLFRTGEDHPWDDSKKTIRQRIRQIFKDAGREYYVPKARFYPMAPMIVPPLVVGDPLLEWYRTDTTPDPHEDIKIKNE